MFDGLNFLLNLDLFGSEVKLSVKKSYQHRTFVGASISASIMILVLYAFVVLMNDMLYIQVPSVLQIEKFNTNPDKYELSREKFFFAMSVVNVYGIPIIQTLNNTIFTAEAQHCHRSSIVKDNKPFYQVQCEVYQMVPCIEANLSVNLMKVNPPGQFYNLFYCINNSELIQSNMSLQGTGQSIEFQTLNMKIRPCTNKTQNGTGKTCASQEVIDANLNYGFIALSFPDRILDQQASGNPYITVNKLIVTAISNTQQTNKFLYINLKHSRNKSYKNFFFFDQQLVENHELVFDSLQESTEITINPFTKATQIFGCLIQFTDREVVYQRNYYDILRVLGNLGGLINLLVFLGNLIIKPISKLSLDLNLVNQIFSFQNDKVSKKQQSTMRESNALILQQIAVDKKDKDKGPRNLKKDMHFLKGFFEQKLHSLKLGFSDYMFQCFSSPKQKQIQVGVEKLNQKLDVIFLIKKLIEIDKLKILLLNSDQLKLFDYIPKPHIPLVADSENDVQKKEVQSIHQPAEDLEIISSRKEFDLFQIEKPFVDNVQQAFEAYKTITSRNNNTNISMKLIELMDMEIKMLFDHTIHLQLRDVKSMNDESGQFQINPKQIIDDSPYQQMSPISQPSASAEQQIYKQDNIIEDFSK